MMALLDERDGTFSVVEEETGLQIQGRAWLVIRRRLAMGFDSAAAAKRGAIAFGLEHGPLLEGVWSASSEVTAKLVGPSPEL